jgi:PKD repeat protein
MFQKGYGSVGTFTVTAEVYDSTSGEYGKGSTSVQIAAELTTTFTADKTSGGVPLTVTFTFSMSGGYTPYTWSLDPGDGTTPYSNPASPKSHTYTKVGTYTAILNVSDALGGSVSAQVAVGAGVHIFFPKLRELFPRIFERIDKARERAREIAPTIPAP